MVPQLSSIKAPTCSRDQMALEDAGWSLSLLLVFNYPAPSKDPVLESGTSLDGEMWSCGEPKLSKQLACALALFSPPAARAGHWQDLCAGPGRVSPGGCDADTTWCHVESQLLCGAQKKAS
jgi:hypothetical protein